MINSFDPPIIKNFESHIMFGYWSVLKVILFFLGTVFSQIVSRAVESYLEYSFSAILLACGLSIHFGGLFFAPSSNSISFVSFLVALTSLLASGILESAAISSSLTGMLRAQPLLLFVFFVSSPKSRWKRSIGVAISVIFTLLSMLNSNNNFTPICSVMAMGAMLVAMKWSRQQQPGASHSIKQLYTVAGLLLGLFGGLSLLMVQGTAIEASFLVGLCILTMAKTVAVVLMLRLWVMCDDPEIAVGTWCFGNFLVVCLNVLSIWLFGYRILTSNDDSYTYLGYVLAGCVLHMVHLRKCVGHLDYLGAKNEDVSIESAQGGFIRWGVELAGRSNGKQGPRICLAFMFDIMRLGVSEPFYWIATAICAIGTMCAPQDFRFYLHKCIQPKGVQVGTALFIGSKSPPAPGFFQCNVGIIDSIGPDWVATNKESVAILSQWGDEDEDGGEKEDGGSNKNNNIDDEESKASTYSPDGFCGNIVAEVPLYPDSIGTTSRYLTAYFASSIRQFNISAWSSAEAAEAWAKKNAPHKRIVRMQGTDAANGGFSSFSGLLTRLVPEGPLFYGVRCTNCHQACYTYPKTTTCQRCAQPLPKHPLF